MMTAFINHSHRDFLFLVSVAFVCLFSLTNGRSEIRFQHHFVDDDGPVGEAWASLVLADVDKDGKLDVVTGKSKHFSGERRVVWYRNKGAIDEWSEPLVLKSGMTTGCGSVMFDVNEDGWPDYFAGRLLVHPGKGVGEKPFTAASWTFGDRLHDLELGDFDNDGRPEVVANLQHSSTPGLFLFHPSDDSEKPWAQTQLVSVPMHRDRKNFGEVHAAISPRGIADLDGDGDLDIAYLGLWCENVDGKGREWEAHHNIDFRPNGPFAQAVRCWVADIDQDGHNDIVQSVCDAAKAKVVWLRNVNGDGSEWDLTELPGLERPGDFHSLAVGDFDLDGDCDVYVDEMEHLHLLNHQARMAFWENIDGRGTEWNLSIFKSGLGGHQAQTADLDGDGDLDIVTRPYTAKGNINGNQMHISVLENLATSPKP